MAAPIITNLPTPTPDRSQSQSEFNTNTAAFLNALPTMVTEENALAVWSNDTAVTVQANADAAANSAAMSASSANFVGSWADQTGAANIPYSVENNSIIYMLLNNLADVTLSEPAVGNADWVETSQKIRVTADETVTVGAGGDFLTINEALEYFDNRYPAYKNTGVTGEISLLAGFVMAEQVIIKGIDFSWIKLTGVDAVTTITRSSLTIGFFDDVIVDTVYPAFTVLDGGQLPEFDQQFNMDSSGSPSERTGIYARNSGPLIISSGGVSSAESVGLILINGSCDFSGVSDFSGAYISVILYLARFHISNSINASGSSRGFVINSSTGIIYGGDASGCSEHGVVTENSHVSFYSTNFQKGGSPSSSDFVTNSGSISYCSSTTGGFSQTVNVQTTSGLILN